MQLTAVHLIDAHLCSDPGKYISALLLSLSTMLHLELPHINVLSKIDLIESYGKLGAVITHFQILDFRSILLFSGYSDRFICWLYVWLLQPLTLISIQTCKTCLIYNTILIKILALLSTGVMWYGDSLTASQLLFLTVFWCFVDNFELFSFLDAEFNISSVWINNVKI